MPQLYCESIPEQCPSVADTPLSEFIGFMLSMVSWFHGFVGFIVSKVSEIHGFRGVTSFSSVLPTSRVGYHASKPIESVVYCFYKITFSRTESFR